MAKDVPLKYNANVLRLAIFYKKQEIK